jgi:hypothetical protein
VKGQWEFVSSNSYGPEGSKYGGLLARRTWSVKFKFSKDLSRVGDVAHNVAHFTSLAPSTSKEVLVDISKDPQREPWTAVIAGGDRTVGSVYYVSPLSLFLHDWMNGSFSSPGLWGKSMRCGVGSREPTFSSTATMQL